MNNMQAYGISGKKISALPELTDLTPSGKEVLIQTATGLQRLSTDNAFDFLAEGKGLGEFTDDGNLKYNGNLINGDMKLSDYVNAGGSGKVLSAANSDKLGGQNSSYYAKQSDVTTLQGASHTHSNKSLLDSYSNSNTNITDAISKKHEHSNKTLLDSYSNSNTDISNAISNSHSHSNKALLDTYSNTNANITDAINNKHTHSNKALLDSYTNTNANLTDAVNSKHSHSNKTQLDKLSEIDGKLAYDGLVIGETVDTDIGLTVVNGMLCVVYNE